MKKMLSLWKVNKTELLTLPLFVLGLSLFGFIMAVVIIAMGEETTSFPMGTVIGSIALIAGALVYISYFRREFMVALTMGATRTEFLLSFALRQLTLLVAGYVLILVLCLAERAAYPLIFPGIIHEFDMLPILTDPRIVLSVMAVALVLSMFLGMLFCRFGKKFLWVVYAVYMLLCFGITRLLHLQWLVDLVVSIPPAGWVGIAIAAAAAMLATTVVLAKKQMVN